MEVTKVKSIARNKKKMGKYRDEIKKALEIIKKVNMPPPKSLKDLEIYVSEVIRDTIPVKYLYEIIASNEILISMNNDIINQKRANGQLGLQVESLLKTENKIYQRQIDSLKNLIDEHSNETP